MDKVEYLTTRLEIKHFNGCNKCPNKLYAKNKDTIKLGVGNIYCNAIFVLPNYNINTNCKYETILDYLLKYYKEVRGENLLEKVYITRLIKCFNYSNYDIEKDCIKNCANMLYYEISRIKAYNIVFFGDTYYEFNKLFNDTIFLGHNIIECFTPILLKYDNIKSKFIKDFNYVMDICKL